MKFNISSIGIYKSFIYSRRLDFFNTIHKRLHTEQRILSIFLGLSKAFESRSRGSAFETRKIWNSRRSSTLLYKIFIQQTSYARDKYQRSPTLPIQTGITQGYVLGPWSFLIYIIDFHS